MEISSIFQCVLCGSYENWVVTRINPDELTTNKSVNGKKVKKQDIHELESQAIVKSLKQKLRGTGGLMVTQNGQGHTGQNSDIKHCSFGYSNLPCATCYEYYSGQKFQDSVLGAGREALEANSNGNNGINNGKNNTSNKNPVSMSMNHGHLAVKDTPHITVMFETPLSNSSQMTNGTDDSDSNYPPGYRNIHASNKPNWVLREGVGPQKLEVQKALPRRLPAQQFKKLLPGKITPSPSCWGTAVSNENVENLKREETILRPFLAELFSDNRDDATGGFYLEELCKDIIGKPKDPTSETENPENDNQKDIDNVDMVQGDNQNYQNPNANGLSEVQALTSYLIKNNVLSNLEENLYVKNPILCNSEIMNELEERMAEIRIERKDAIWKKG